MSEQVRQKITSFGQLSLLLSTAYLPIASACYNTSMDLESFQSFPARALALVRLSVSVARVE